jgi:mono/diheme cytochrome c family protein
MLAGVYGFVNVEDTALTTVPPQPTQIPVFVPQTPTPVPTLAPTATPVPVTPESQPAQPGSGPTWADVAPLFAVKCGACHATTDLTGLAFDTYANTLAGGTDGPVVVPGDSTGSGLITSQEAGGHPGMFTEDELGIVKAWIDVGAPESSEPIGGPVWEGELAALLEEKCAACHGPTALGGLNLSTYTDLEAGGQSGPAFVPGDSANSPLVTLQQAGGHPGQLTPEEIELLMAWIDAGALEK